MPLRVAGAARGAALAAAGRARRPAARRASRLPRSVPRRRRRGVGDDRRTRRRDLDRLAASRSPSAMIPLLRRVDGLRYLRGSAVAAAASSSAFLLVPGVGAKLVFVAALALVNAGWYPVLQARLYDALGGSSSLVLTVGRPLSARRGAAARDRGAGRAVRPQHRVVAAAARSGCAARARAQALTTAYTQRVPRCASCGHENREGARFCDACGAAARRGRRRRRAAQDGDGALLRRHRLDGARRAARPRVAAGGDGALLRRGAGGRRAPRRLGREVHRRRGDGGVRHPGRCTRTTRCGRCAPPPSCATGSPS